jgi:hypothetical protein
MRSPTMRKPVSIARLFILFPLVLAGACQDTPASSETDLAPAATAKADSPMMELCTKIQEGTVEIEELGEGAILTRENWKMVDVIADMDYRNCGDGQITQSKIQIDGETFWQFTSNDDSCDGGNSYGSIMTEDLTTAVAHIYDSDLTCADWRPESLASNHKCDAAAETLAQEKMTAFGLAFEPQASGVEVRDPYVYSFVTVTGTLTDRPLEDGEPREADIRVLTRLSDCRFGGVRIVDLDIE